MKLSITKNENGTATVKYTDGNGNPQATLCKNVAEACRVAEKLNKEKTK